MENESTKITYAYVCACVFVCVCARACVHVCDGVVIAFFIIHFQNLLMASDVQLFLCYLLNQQKRRKKTKVSRTYLFYCVNS